MLNSIKAEVNRQAWDMHRQRGLLALSGGRDSIALFWAFRELGYAFEVAHINYGLRGAESDSDEAFVRKICIEEGIEVHVLKAAEIPQNIGESTQMWARRIRYDFFEGILSSRNLDYTAVAHHAGDQLEHFFIYLWRNQMDKAFRGILPQNGSVIRPMLGVLPSQIQNFLEKDGKSWREDSSNQKLDYVRNKVRHGIIGFMEESEPLIKEFLLLSKSTQKEWQRQELAHAVKWDISELTHGFWTFQSRDLNALPIIWKQVLLRLGFSQDIWSNLVSTANVRVGARFLSKTGYTIVGARNQTFMLFKDIENIFYFELSLDESAIFEFAGRTYRFMRGQDLDASYEKIGIIPKEYENKRVIIRSQKLGDRIALKNGGSQKVSDLMTNEKWNPYQKSRVLIIEQEGKVLDVITPNRKRFKFNDSDWVLVV